MLAQYHLETLARLDVPCTEPPFWLMPDQRNLDLDLASRKVRLRELADPATHRGAVLFGDEGAERGGDRAVISGSQGIWGVNGGARVPASETDDTSRSRATRQRTRRQTRVPAR